MRSRLFLLLLLGGCGGAGDLSDDPDHRAEWTSVHERPCAEDSVLTWESFGAPFLRNWCTGCHSADVAGAARYGAPTGVDFDTPAAARAWREAIWLRAGDANETMPPAGGPGEEERRLLGVWLACGAP